MATGSAGVSRKRKNISVSTTHRTRTICASRRRRYRRRTRLRFREQQVAAAVPGVAGLGEQVACLVEVELGGGDIRIVPGLEHGRDRRALRGDAGATERDVDELARVDGVGEGFAEARIVEWLAAVVHGQVPEL